MKKIIRIVIYSEIENYGEFSFEDEGEEEYMEAREKYLELAETESENFELVKTFCQFYESKYTFNNKYDLEIISMGGEIIVEINEGKLEEFTEELNNLNYRTEYFEPIIKKCEEYIPKVV